VELRSTALISRSETTTRTSELTLDFTLGDDAAGINVPTVLCDNSGLLPSGLVAGGVKDSLNIIVIYRT